MATEKKQSHYGAALIAGALVGMAAGLFVQSKQGKTLRKDLQKKGSMFQKKLMKELKDTKELTKEKYEEIVDKMMAYYEQTKEVAKNEVPEVRKFLMKNWTEVNKQLKSVK
jgi:gas vesicle protein